jgi:hypothetical protein
MTAQTDAAAELLSLFDEIPARFELPWGRLKT